MYGRQVLADKVSNYEKRLPSEQSAIALQTMKDPYVFDFISLREDMVEKDIEDALVGNITKFLLELGIKTDIETKSFCVSITEDENEKEYSFTLWLLENSR